MATLAQGRAGPRALASADFDEDGAPDLLVGYTDGSAGLLTLQRGNMIARYSQTHQVKPRRFEERLNPELFAPNAQVFPMPAEIDFLAAGDFDADGHADVVAAARGRAMLGWRAGDGRGGLGPAQIVPLPGNVTALATGDANRRDGLLEILVGVNTTSGGQALVFEGPEGALRAAPEAFTTAATVTGLVVAQLDGDPWADIALTAGAAVQVIRGRDRKLSQDTAHRAAVAPAAIEIREFPQELAGLAAGDFDGCRKDELALLTAKGAVWKLRHEEADAPLTAWPQEEIWAGGATQIRAARVTDTDAAQILVWDESRSHLLAAQNVATWEGTGAVLPLRLNADALDDLVTLDGNGLSVRFTTPAATFLVTNTADSGPGSLRQALLDTNANPGADAVNFNIPGAGVRTITPQSPLPQINGAVTIDGTTQPGFAGAPLIEIRGEAAQVPKGSGGLEFTGGNSTARALIINRFSQAAGLRLLNGGNNIVAGNYLGTNAAGTAAASNRTGLVCENSANNLIGGNVPAARNIVSGNTVGGALFSGLGATGNTLSGNYVGLDAAGVSSVPNTFASIAISDGANQNTIGGPTAGARNIISGNSLANDGLGAVTISENSNANILQGNYIGTNPAGAARLRNQGPGVLLLNTNNNTVGGTASGTGNLISGNDEGGIVGLLSAPGTLSGNKIQGNLIGTNANGDAALFNRSFGIVLGGGQSTLIGGTTSGARNVISGTQVLPKNSSAGILVDDSNQTVIQGNYLGVARNGLDALPNQTDAGIILSDSSQTLLGGTDAGAGNVISGTRGFEYSDGLMLRCEPPPAMTNCRDNTIQGNFIGTDATGMNSGPQLGNRNSGILLDSAGNNLIGGTVSGAGNVISGQNGENSDGIVLLDGSNDNRLQGNFIGTDKNGTAALGNTGNGILLAHDIRFTTRVTGNLIGGDTSAGRNIISSNSGNGIQLADASGNTIRFNYIGTNASGNCGLNNAFGNRAGGIRVNAETADNMVRDNLISCNSGNGVSVPNDSEDPGLPGARIRIEDNFIHGNELMGIDLGPSGITANDLNDPDNGANSQQNFPVLEDMLVSGNLAHPAAMLTVNGTLNSRPNTTYSINWFYSNVTQCGLNQNGPPLAFGRVPGVMTDANGNAPISFPFTFPPGQTAGVINCTATDSDGNTSEFSSCLPVSVAGTAQLSSLVYERNESGGAAIITVTRGGAGLVTVNYATSDGTATAGQDYIAANGVLTFAAGETSKTFTVTLTNDKEAEGNETLNLALSNPTGGAVLGVRGSAVLTIVDDDSASLQFSQTVYPASEGAGVALISVTRTGLAAEAVTVDYATDDGPYVPCSALNGNLAAQNCDYTATAGTLNFAPGETLKTFAVPLNDDAYVENSESLTLFLGLAMGANVQLGTPDTATLIIQNNDSQAPNATRLLARLSGGQAVPANNSTATGDGVVTLTGPATAQATVNFAGPNSVGASLNGPASFGLVAPLLFNTPPNQTTNLTLNAEQMRQLRAGLLYFNVRSSTFPNGEVRGAALANPIDDTRFFVRQQYADFLSRAPDAQGWDYWTGQLGEAVQNCPDNIVACLGLRRTGVSNAFFFELEYQQTGAYAYRLYRAAYGNTQPFPNPTGDMDADPFCQANPNNCRLIRAAQIPSYQQFASDRARLDANQLAATQLALATTFAQRPEFVARYPLSQTAGQYVDALLTTIQSASNANLTNQRTQLITLYNAAGSSDGGRGAVLFRLAEDNQVSNPINNRAFIDAEYSRAFVLTQYFGYLRRNPDMPGLNFWLGVINRFPIRSATGQNAMVCAFITATEYQARFSALAPRTNAECPTPP